jgi:ring-1,2-phenylacetyl-CoA epoxidase subunit PaaE
MATPRFHPLQIAKIEQQTNDAICVSFHVPNELRADYQFRQGQFLTLKAVVDGEELRRSYSICVGTQRYAQQGLLQVAIKRVADGRFSSWANANLRAGQVVDVMTPDGRFNTPLNAQHAKHYLGMAGGSGITPMLSLIEITLIYGNRGASSVMFLEELDALKSVHLGRLQLVHVLSDEPQEVELFYGVLDRARCDQLLSALQLGDKIDHAFVCGPEPMMNAAEAALLAMGLPASGISIERFGSPSAPRSANKMTSKPAVAVNTPSAQVSLVADGKTRHLQVPFDGTTLLEAGLASGANLPYACKAGVCCTCRARVLEGEVRMDKNYTLEPDEIARGFVLTCQSHPVSERVVVSFDER